MASCHQLAHHRIRHHQLERTRQGGFIFLLRHVGECTCRPAGSGPGGRPLAVAIELLLFFAGCKIFIVPMNPRYYTVYDIYEISRYTWYRFRSKLQLHVQKNIFHLPLIESSNNVSVHRNISHQHINTNIRTCLCRNSITLAKCFAFI